MNDLLGKLTNLGYEFFGVFLPGIVFGVFVLAWWFAMGAFGSWLTGNQVPHLSLGQIPTLATHLKAWEALIPVSVLVYLLGHLLLWVARSGPKFDKTASKSGSLKRLVSCLKFKIPKPEDSYDPSLSRLYEKAVEQIQGFDPPLNWREFYPLAKSMIAQHVKYSLTSTYQNKYTLHRSLTTAATILTWISFVGLVGGLLATSWIPERPHFLALGGLTISGLVVVWGFSDSYMFHWKNWGNTIVTESYVFLATKGVDDQSKYESISR